MFRSVISSVTVAAVLLAGGCGKEPEKPALVRPVLAVKVGDTEQLTRRSFPGRAKAHQEVDLSFRVAGPLIELPNDVVGREYKQGEVIARIDPRDFEVSIRDAEGKLQRARSNLKRAAGEYERELNIFNQDAGATSRTAVDRKRDARDAAAGDIKSLEAALDAARDDLSYTYLKAPFAGRITARYVENFQDVRAKQQVVRLLDASRVQMVVDIPETLIHRLPDVQDIHVIFDAFPGKKIPAEIFEVGKEASLTTRTYPVTLVMDQPQDVEILAGMAGRAYGRARSAAEAVEEGVVVPLGAVFTPPTESGNYVWIVDASSGMVSRRAVTTGELVPGGVRVSEGLAIGEWVVTAGVYSLQEGQRVRIAESSGG